MGSPRVDEGDDKQWMTQSDSDGGVVQGTWVLYGGACGDGGTRYQNTLTPDLSLCLASLSTYFNSKLQNKESTWSPKPIIFSYSIILLLESYSCILVCCTYSILDKVELHYAPP